MQSRRVRRAEHAARMGETRNSCKIVVGKREKNIEDQGVDGMMIEWILKKWDGKLRTGLIGNCGGFLCTR
jgi:hypothetical protein